MGQYARFGHDKAPCLHHRAHDGRPIAGNQGSKVHDFHLDAFREQLLRPLQSGSDHGANRHQGDVPALSLDLRDPDGHDILLLGYGTNHRVEELVLEKKDRIVGADGCFEHALGIIGRTRSHDNQTRDAGQPDFETLRVLGSHADSPSAGSSNHERQRILASAHAAKLGRLVHDGVHAGGQEVRKKNLSHGEASGHGRTHCSTNDGILTDGSVHDALRAEAFSDSGGHSKITAHGDILAQQEHPLVADHLLGQGFEKGLGTADLAARG